MAAQQLFHLDRLRRLHSGMVVERLRRDDDALAELLPHLHALHPEGISHWGLHLLQPIDETGAERARRVATVAAEMSFEWVRRAKFAHRPSRFESLFCCASPSEARLLAPDDDGAPLWRVELVEDVAPFRGDANWYALGGSALELSSNAHRYWEGEATSTPTWEWLCPLPVRVVEAC